ncbi:MAG TPA: hypothetical protein VMT47_08945, partial [Polyangia bacterium]|nr:hypothetical protein [Polyangia bacterium]
MPPASTEIRPGQREGRLAGAPDNSSDRPPADAGASPRASTNRAPARARVAGALALPVTLVVVVLATLLGPAHVSV